MNFSTLRNLSAAGTLLAAVSAGAAVKVGTPTIDGTGIDTTNYDLIALRTNTNNGFGGSNIAAGLYMAQDATSLYIGIAGNLSGNSYHIFLDTKAGGAANVATDPSPGYGEFNDLATAGSGVMPTTPTAFLVDYVITVKASTDLGLWDVQANTAGYKGNSGTPNAGYAMSINNTNAVTAPPYTAVSTGLELKIPKADIGSPTGNIGIFLILGNDNKGGNPATYMSNVTLPDNASASNFGNDGAAGSGGNGVNYNGTGGPAIVALTPQLPVSVSGFGIE